MCDLANYQSLVSRSEFACLVFIVRMTHCKGLDSDQIPLAYFSAPGGAGYSRRSVITALGRLKKRGLLEVTASRFGRAASRFRPLIGHAQPAAAPSVPTAPDMPTVAHEVQPLHATKDIVHSSSSLVSSNVRSDQSLNDEDRTGTETAEKPSQPEPDLGRWSQAEWTAVTQQIAAYGGRFKQPPPGVVRRVLAAGEAWGKNGFESGAALYSALKTVQRKPEYKPREWSWFATVVRNRFQAETSEDRDYGREAVRSKNVQAEKVEHIDTRERSLPLAEPQAQADYYPPRMLDDADELIRKIPRRAGEPDAAYRNRAGFYLRCPRNAEESYDAWEDRFNRTFWDAVARASKVS